MTKSCCPLTRPQSSQETIQRMTKLVHQEAEAAKQSVRNARHKALDRAKKVFSARDDLKAAEKEVQARQKACLNVPD